MPGVSASREQRQYALHALTAGPEREFEVIFIEELIVRAPAPGLHSHAIRDAPLNTRFTI